MSVLKEFPRIETLGSEKENRLLCLTDLWSLLCRWKSLGENCSVIMFEGPCPLCLCGANLSYVMAVGKTSIWLGLAGSELEQMDSPTHPPVLAVRDCGSRHHHCC